MDNSNSLQNIAYIYKVTCESYERYAISQSLPKMQPNITNLQDLTTILKENLPLSLDRSHLIHQASDKFCLDTLLLSLLKKSIFKNGQIQPDFTARNKLVVILKILGSVFNMVNGRKYLECWILISMSALFSKIEEHNSCQKILKFYINCSDSLPLTPILGKAQQLSKIFNTKNRQQYQRFRRDKKSLKENMEFGELSREDILLEIRARLFLIFSISICYAQPSKIDSIYEKFQLYFACRPQQLDGLSQLKSTDIRKIDYQISVQNEDKLPFIEINESLTIQIEQKLIIMYPDILIDSECVPEVEKDVKTVYREMQYDMIEFLIIDPDITDFEIFCFKAYHRINFDQCDFQQFKDVLTALQYIEQNTKANHSIIINAKYIVESSWIQKYLQKLFKFYYYGELLPEINLPISSKIKQLNETGFGCKEEFQNSIKKMKLAEDIREQLLYYNIASFTPNFTIVNQYDKNIDFDKANRNCRLLVSLLSPTNHKQSVKNFISLVKAGQSYLREEEQEILQRIQSLPFDEYRKHVIEDYKRETFFYKILNRGLRSLSKQKYWPYIQYPVAALFFEIRNRYLEHFHPQQRKYYRCCYLNKNEIQFLKIKGNIFRTEGFFSTSKSKQMAGRFGDYLFILTVPKNTTDTNITGFADIENQKTMGENETLFNPGNYFKVTSFRQNLDFRQKWSNQKKVIIEAQLIFIDQLEKRQLEATAAEKDLINLIKDQKNIFLKNHAKNNHLIVEQQKQIGSKIFQGDSSLELQEFPFSLINFEEELSEQIKDISHLIFERQCSRQIKEMKGAKIRFIKYLFKDAWDLGGFLFNLFANSPSKLFKQKIIRLNEKIIQTLRQTFIANKRPHHNYNQFPCMQNIVSLMKLSMLDPEEIQENGSNFIQGWDQLKSLLKINKKSLWTILSIIDKSSKYPDTQISQILENYQSNKKVTKIYQQNKYQLEKYLKDQVIMKSVNDKYFQFIDLIVSKYVIQLGNQSTKLKESGKLQDFLRRVARVLELMKECIQKVPSQREREKMLEIYSKKFSFFQFMRNQSDNLNVSCYCSYQTQKLSVTDEDTNLCKINIACLLAKLGRYELALEKFQQIYDKIGKQLDDTQKRAALYLQKMGEIKKAQQILLKMETSYAMTPDSRSTDLLRILSYGDMQENLSKFKTWKSFTTKQQIQVLQSVFDQKNSIQESFTLSGLNQALKYLRLLYLSDVKKYHKNDIHVYQKILQSRMIISISKFRQEIPETLSQLNFDLLPQIGEQYFRNFLGDNIHDVYNQIDQPLKDSPVILGYDYYLFSALYPMQDRQIKAQQIKIDNPSYIWMKMEPLLIQKINETKQDQLYDWAQKLYQQLRSLFCEFPEISQFITSRLQKLPHLKQNKTEIITPLFQNPKSDIQSAIQKKAQHLEKQIYRSQSDNPVAKILRNSFKSMIKLPYSDRSSIYKTFLAFGEQFQQQYRINLSKICYQLALEASYDRLTCEGIQEEWQNVGDLFWKLSDLYERSGNGELQGRYKQMAQLSRKLKANESDLVAIKAFFYKWEDIKKMNIEYKEGNELIEKYPKQN